MDHMIISLSTADNLVMILIMSLALSKHCFSVRFHVVMSGEATG